MYETSTPQYESRHRLTWAARYPLKPGRDVASRRGLLVQIADTAISGEYWVSQEKLAERMGLTVRHLRRKLVKLCAEGVLQAHPRGYKQTTVYTLMRLDEVAQHGDFLPLNGDATSDRTSRPSQIPPPFDRTSRSSQIGLTGPPGPLATGPPGPPKEVISQEYIKREAAAAAPPSGDPVRFAHPLQRSYAEGVAAPSQDAAPAAAAADFVSDSSTDTDTRHVCPKCENTWPKQYGPVCFTCKCNVERYQRREKLHTKILEDARLFDEAHPPAPPPPPVSKTALRLNNASGGRLPESWLYHQNLKTLIANRDFREVCGIVGGIEASKLPEPKAFFDAYDQHLEAHNQGEAELKALGSKSSRHSRQAA